MPNRLHRYYGAGYLHFITSSCYQRRRLLGSGRNRDLFLEVLESVRRRYHYPSVVMQALKQGFARRFLARLRRATDRRQSSLWDTAVEEGHVWQHRFYDFVVFTAKKRVEKLHYMHENPVRRGLVLGAGQWAWSSYRAYALGERGPVLVNERQKIELRVRQTSSGTIVGGAHASKTAKRGAA